MVRQIDVLAIISPVVDLNKDEYYRMIGIVRKEENIFQFQRIIPLLPPMWRTIHLDWCTLILKLDNIIYQMNDYDIK